MCRLVIGLAVFLSVTVARAATLPSIYWSEPTGVFRAGIDGAGIAPVLQARNIGGVVPDRAFDRLFLTLLAGTRPPNTPGVVASASLDADELESLVFYVPTPKAIALDKSARVMAWSESETHSISVADYDGANVHMILEPTPWIANINGLAFDPWERKLYFSYINPLVDNLRPGGIARMNLDGSEQETVVDGLVAPEGLAVDHVRGYVYWADPEFGKGLIGRAALDGSDPIKWTGGLGSPQGVAVDPYTNQVYWTDSATGKIQTGTPFVPEIDLVTDRDQPHAIGLLIQSGLDGDTNDDGQVDLFDLNDVRNHFGRTPGPGPGDADLDGDVDIHDLNAVRNNYGSRFTAPAGLNGVPEPSSLLLAGAGVILAGLFASRKRTSPT
jgi:hypothetical protein